MIGLDDCGKEFHLLSDSSPDFHTIKGMDVTIEMVIKAPRGTMAIFKCDYEYWNNITQGLAIKAFMKEHKDD